MSEQTLPYAKRQPYRNQKIRDAARGEECTMNSPWCNYDPETTATCHLDESFAGKGGGQKADDCAVFFGCNGPRSCHAWYGGYEGTREERYFYALRAMYRTTRRLLDLGVLR